MASIFITNKIFTINGVEYGGLDIIGICPHSGTVYVRVFGQRYGKDDNIIIDAYNNNKDIHIFSRRKPNTPFIYWGVGQRISYTPRSIPVNEDANTNQLSKFEFKIDKENVMKNIINRTELFNGTGCYKKACLAKIGHSKPDKAQILSGFVRIR